MPTLRQALLFCVLLTACGADDHGDDELGTTSELVAPKKDHTDSKRPGHTDGGTAKGEAKPGMGRPAPRSCDDLQESARTLLGSFQQCTQDSDCVGGKVDAPCLTPFLCQVGVNRHADLQTLAQDARSLSLRYRQVCGDRCPVARCISPESLHTFCDPESKRCASRPRSAPTEPETDAGSTPVLDDAGSTPAPGTSSPAADAGAPAQPSPFACTKNADCTVKNVGNCCGYYPRCANVAATFAPPDCEGRAGVCGFPTIDSCECRENTCVSLQNGQRI